MKSIEEAAKEYSNTSGNQSSKSMRETEYDTGRFVGFKAGVEFAQRWIPVEEELPEEFDTVLVKDSNGCIALATILVSSRIGKYFSVDSGGVENVRYWRPIEIK